MVQPSASWRIRGCDTNRPPAAIFSQPGDLSQPSRFPPVPKPGAHRPDHRLRRRAWTQTRSPVKTRAGVAHAVGLNTGGAWRLMCGLPWSTARVVGRSSRARMGSRAARRSLGPTRRGRHAVSCRYRRPSTLGLKRWLVELPLWGNSADPTTEPSRAYPVTRREAYKRYLQSSDWKKKCGEKISLSPTGRCCICNRHKGIQIHHMLYRRLWSDATMSDLRVVCGRCHRMIHRLIDGDEQKRSDHRRDWNWLKRNIKRKVRHRRRVAARLAGNMSGDCT